MGRSTGASRLVNASSSLVGWKPNVGVLPASTYFYKGSDVHGRPANDEKGMHYTQLPPPPQDIKWSDEVCLTVQSLLQRHRTQPACLGPVHM